MELIEIQLKLEEQGFVNLEFGILFYDNSLLSQVKLYKQGLWHLFNFLGLKYKLKLSDRVKNKHHLDTSDWGKK